MTNPYNQELYQDFSTKQTSINTYIDRAGEGSKAVEHAVYQWLSALKKKHEIIDDFRQSRKKTVPASQFSLEQSQEDTAQVTNSDLKKLEADIQEKARVINHLFQKNEKNLVYLTQSYKQLAEIVNSLADTFDESFKGM
jgi:hypothetical protein